MGIDKASWFCYIENSRLLFFWIVVAYGSATFSPSSEARFSNESGFIFGPDERGLPPPPPRGLFFFLKNFFFFSSLFFFIVFSCSLNAKLSYKSFGPHGSA